MCGPKEQTHRQTCGMGSMCGPKEQTQTTKKGRQTDRQTDRHENRYIQKEELDYEKNSTVQFEDILSLY